MDIGKALLVKSSRDLLTQLVFVTATNASHRYPRGRDQNQYKFTVRWRYYWKTIVKTHKIRSTFYTGSTLRKLFYKPKHWVTTEDKNVFYENNSSNCESVYFGDLTKYLLGIAIVIRMKLQNTVGKQITTSAGIRRKLLIGKADQFLWWSKKHTFFEES